MRNFTEQEDQLYRKSLEWINKEYPKLGIKAKEALLKAIIHGYLLGTNPLLFNS